eukprot:2625643-Rhodomonas_salina.2
MDPTTCALKINDGLFGRCLPGFYAAMESYPGYPGTPTDGPREGPPTITSISITTLAPRGCPRAIAANVIFLAHVCLPRCNN